MKIHSFKFPRDINRAVQGKVSIVKIISNINTCIPADSDPKVSVSDRQSFQKQVEPKVILSRASEQSTRGFHPRFPCVHVSYRLHRFADKRVDSCRCAGRGCRGGCKSKQASGPASERASESGRCTRERSGGRKRELGQQEGPRLSWNSRFPLK